MSRDKLGPVLPAAFLGGAVLLGWAHLTQAGGSVAESSWTQRGFEDFRQGTFEDAGNDLYVSASGVLQRIHRYDLNSDGSVDLVVCNSHDTDERVDSYIYWGGPQGLDEKRRSEVYASGSQSSEVGDLNGDGYLDLVVAGYYDGDTYRLNSHLYFGTPSGLETQKRVDLPGLAARDAAMADFNRDGHMDLFFAVPWRDGHFEAEEIDGVLYWGSAGGFSPEHTSKIPCRGSVAAEATDLDGNGYPDLILANARGTRNSSTHSFIYWNGPEGFSKKRRSELPTEGATAIAVGDLNGDGLPELAFSSSTGKQTPIYLNSASGFSAERTQVLPQGSAGVAFADVNRDARLDVILATKDSVAVYLNGQGTIAATPAWRVPATRAVHLAAADLNQDGYPELVVSNHSSGFEHSCASFVYWGGPSGYSVDQRTLLPTHGATHASIGDLNRDGYPDVVFSNSQSGHTSEAAIDSYVYWGDEAGRFAPDRRTGLRAVEVTDVTSADLDENGYPDLLFAGEGRRVGSRLEGVPLYMNGPGGFASEPFFFPVIGTRGSEAADLNRDGHLDLILTNPFPRAEPEYPNHSTYIFWGSAEGYRPSNYHVFSTPDAYRFSLADLDRDGFLDMVVGRMYQNCLSIYWGNAAGTFSAAQRLDLPTQLCNNVNVADLDGDGYLDLVAGNKGSRETAEGPLMIYWGGPAQGSAREGLYETGRRTDLPTIAGTRTAIGDFDRDGRLDVCVTNYQGDHHRRVPSYVYWGDGRRFDEARRTVIPFEAGSGALSADFDRDGWLDLALASHKGGSKHVTFSKVFWGSPQGLLSRLPTELPTVGAHQFQNRNIGHIFDRGPGVAYLSPAHSYRGLPQRLTWEGSTPGRTALTFQVRTATTAGELEKQPWSSSSEGRSIDLSRLRLPSSGLIQYRVDLISPDGGLSPRLNEVTIWFRE